jgi:long-chain acyl-CoA synthetase
MEFVATSFKDCFRKFSDSVLFIEDDGDRIVNYGNILEISERWYSYTRNKVILCLIENNIDALTGYLSLLISDSVLIIMSADTKEEHITRIVNLYEPNYCFLSRTRMGCVNKINETAVIGKYVLVELNTVKHNLNVQNRILLSTSGSTGSPKFVRISERNIYSNAKAISDYLGLTASEIPVTSLPPNYSYGLSVIHSHIINGCKIALTKRTFFDKSFWDFIVKEKITSLAGVPYHYEMLKKLKIFKMDLPQLKTFTQAGGRLNADLVFEFAQYCKESGKKFFVMYGQTEATARMAYLNVNKSLTKPTSIGNAIPGGEFWLEDNQGNIIIGSEKKGQLIYRGPNVSMGYAENYLDLAKGDENGGVLKTGDLAYCDEYGDFYIVGRMNRFIKLFGNRISLDEIEKYCVSKGIECACVGSDNQLEIYVLNSSVDKIANLKMDLMSSFSINHGVVKVYSLMHFPRTDFGKIKYSDLMPIHGTLLIV